MAKRARTEPEAAGADSFLDITTNVVGILIILVMVVGERAKTAPVDVAPPAASAELVAARSESQSLEKDVHHIAEQMAVVQAELQARAAERGNLATLIAAIERDLAEHRATLDEKAQQRLEADQKLALAKAELGRLEAERQRAEKQAAPTTIKIESYPTPLGKTVNGDEAHLRLKGGRLAVVPFEPLMDRLRRSLREIVTSMNGQAEIVDTLGPVEGFRLRYVIQRHDTVGAAMFQLAYVEFVPISSQLGEPVEEALQPGSKFRQMLATLSPERYTITVWTYTDSFAEYRQLKKALYAAGYSVAARPLADGMPIGASPSGSKSSAQ